MGTNLYNEFKTAIRHFFQSICRRFLIHLDHLNDHVNQQDLEYYITGQNISQGDENTEPEEGFMYKFNPMRYEDPENDGNLYLLSSSHSYYQENFQIYM